jgi:gluconokinase
MSSVYIIMGVSGCGKSTVGELLANRLNIPFYDADDFHPEVNINKMSAGIPLNDDDRLPWLETLAASIKEWADNKGAVLACSALKASYRTILRSQYTDVIFVYLNASEEVIRNRFAQRSDHFMPDSLILSQFDALEVPTHAQQINAELPISEIIDLITDVKPSN